ncbi:hypothetical protein C8F01DRAFT_1271506 [Mycena amicta]|nr:hypothetical protein C8F01DRAFT_1271506 [Mycena amicta]
MMPALAELERQLRPRIRPTTHRSLGSGNIHGTLFVVGVFSISIEPTNSSNGNATNPPASSAARFGSLSVSRSAESANSNNGNGNGKRVGRYYYRSMRGLERKKRRLLDVYLYPRGNVNSNVRGTEARINALWGKCTKNAAAAAGRHGNCY